MSEVKLKPCPFCCGEAYTYASHNYEVGRAYLVHCRKCRINYPLNIVCKTEEEAIQAWNTRKPMEDIVERLEEELKLADEEKERCSRENHLMFDGAKSYATGISNAIEIVKGGVE